MAQYKTGRVSINHGSTSVIGHGTSWVADGISSDWILTIKGDRNIYWISSVDDEDEITLSQNYYNLGGENLYHSEYAIVQDYTTNYEWPKIAKTDYNWVNILRRTMIEIEQDMAAGQRSTVTFSSPSQGTSGQYYSFTSGANVTYYLPDSSIPAQEGVLYYDTYREEFIYLAGGMVSGGDTSGSDYLPIWVPNWRKFKTFT